MKRFCCYMCFISALFLFQACNKTDVYAQKAKSLDSLGGAVNSMIRQFEMVDTITLQKAVTRFNYYDQFIQQNLNDTVDKNSADDLVRFYKSGKTLQDFLINRTSVIVRSKFIAAQLSKLAEDIKAGVMDENQLVKFSAQENEEATRIIEIGSDQQKMFYLGMEEFKNSLPGVERLIRSHNNGELPVIIKDTVNL